MKCLARARVPRAFSLLIALLAINLSIVAFAGSRLPVQSSSSTPQDTASTAKPLDDYAVQKVQSVYPPLAKAAKVTGTVLVLVTLDEQGTVVSAEAVSGHPLLRDAAVTAARGWKFKPARTRVVGTITFSFELDRSQKTDGQRLDQMQDPRTAYLERMRDEVKAKPDSPEAHYQLGLAWQMQRKTEEAIASFKQALQLKPDYPEAYKGLVQLYMGARRYDDAISILRQRVALKPDDAAAYQQLGQVYYNLHKFEEAIEADKRALQVKPPYDLSYQVYRDMGVAHVYLRQFDEAMDAINKSLELKPDESLTLRCLAWTYQVQGRLR